MNCELLKRWYINVVQKDYTDSKGLLHKKGETQKQLQYVLRLPSGSNLVIKNAFKNDYNVLANIATKDDKNPIVFHNDVSEKDREEWKKLLGE